MYVMRQCLAMNRHVDSCTASQPSIDAYYDQNDTMPSFVMDQGAYVFTTADRYWSLPTASFDGLCNDRSFALFEVAVDADANQCQRAVPLTGDASTLSSHCLSLNSVQRFVTELLIGRCGAGSLPDTSTT